MVCRLGLGFLFNMDNSNLKMNKSFQENLNVSKSSSQTRRQITTDRSPLADCTETVQKYSQDYKDLTKDLKSFQHKITNYKELIETYKKFIQSSEIEIDKLQNNISVLQKETETVLNANEKIAKDTELAIEGKKGMLKEIKVEEEKFCNFSEKMWEKMQIEKKIVEKLQKMNEKMRKQIIVEQRLRDEARNENKRIKVKISAAKEKIDKCKFAAVDILNKLGL